MDVEATLTAILQEQRVQRQMLTGKDGDREDGGIVGDLRDIKRIVRRGGRIAGWLGGILAAVCTTVAIKLLSG